MGDGADNLFDIAMKREFNILHSLSICAAVAGILSPGCSQNMISEQEQSPSESVRVYVEYEGMHAAETKSSFTWKDDDISDIQAIIAEEDGTVCDIIYSDDTVGLSFKGTVGRKYYVLAAANMGERLNCSDISELATMTRNVEYSKISSDGIPMFSDHAEEITISKGSNTVTVKLVRMMARVDLTVDRKLLENGDGFSVKSVKIYNATNLYSLFPSAARKTDPQGGSTLDYASTNDLAALNNGGPISLYAFENMQGTLLPGNTDPWAKVPSSISSTADLCSYLELKCSYTGKERSCDDITYRMYLGNDITTNFDIARNTVYKLTLIPTEEEIYGNRGSWKIESSGWTDNPGNRITVTQYELTILPGKITLKTGGNAKAAAYLQTRTGTRLESETDRDIKDWTSWSPLRDVTKNSNTTWYSLDDDIATVYEGTVTAGDKTGTVKIFAEYDTGGGEECYDYCNVTVESSVTCDRMELVMDPDAIFVGETSEGTVILYWSDGTTTTVSNNDCSWSVNRGGTVSKGTFTGTEAGTSTITAAYQGMRASCDVEVRNAVSRRLVVTPESSEIDENESVQLSATLYTTTNGHEDNGVDVTRQSVWDIKSGSSNISNNGNGLFTWKDGPGSSVVKATYSDSEGSLSDEAVIYTTEPIYLVSLVAAPSEIVLDHRNFWSEGFSFVATYSDGSTEDVTREVEYNVPSFILAVNGTADAIGEGTGRLEGTYRFRGLSKSASIQITSIDEWMTEGIHCQVHKEGSYFIVYDIVASKHGQFTMSRNFPLSKSDYTYTTEGTGTVEEIPEGFKVTGDVELTVSYDCPVTGETLFFTLVFKGGICTNITD